MEGMPPHAIKRIVYSEEYCYPMGIERDRNRYEFLPDGTIIKKHTLIATRKCIEKEIFHVTVDLMWAFYEKIYQCARNANGCEIFIDDCAGTLTIEYDYMHSETMERGLHSSDVYIDTLVREMIRLFQPEED